MTFIVISFQQQALGNALNVDKYRSRNLTSVILQNQSCLQTSGTAQEPGSSHMVGRDTTKQIGKGASPEVQRTNTAYLLSPSTDTFSLLARHRLLVLRSSF